jgi:predicted transcriptional regulator
MAILKSPPKPLKNETLQIRVEEEIKTRLAKYAEFIDSSESYVVSEALRLLFRKDDEFKAWLEQREPADERVQNQTEPNGESLSRSASRSPKPGTQLSTQRS